VARAQQAAKLPIIGFLGAATPSTTTPWIAAFVQRLREFGWVEGRNIVIAYRWAEGRTEGYAGLPPPIWRPQARHQGDK
jgi:putative ABC transport system substrate-binding protein